MGKARNGMRSELQSFIPSNSAFRMAERSSVGWRPYSMHTAPSMILLETAALTERVLTIGICVIGLVRAGCYSLAALC